MARRVVIDPNPLPLGEAVRELVGQRDLLYVLAHRDHRVKYAQTFLGYAWAVLQPLLTVVVLAVVFGGVIGVDTGGVPYPLFVMAGLISWNYVAAVMAQAGGSLIGAQAMVKKIYFPRLVIPLSKGLAALVDLGVAFLLYLGLMTWYRTFPGRELLWLPLFVASAVVTAVGIGIWLSALTIRYRDIQHVVPFLVQIGLYATPVAYPVTLVPARHQWLFSLNPLTGVVEGFRWSLLGGTPPTLHALTSAGLGLFLLLTGLAYFRRVERMIADVV